MRRPVTRPRTRAGNAFGQQVADAAEHYLDHTPPRTFRDDCSGFVCAVYDRAGAPFEGNTASMWELARQAGSVHYRKMPNPGDLVFFDNTWDRNKNGRLDDHLTHVAIVTDVRADGTITVAHAGLSSGRSAYKMNLLRPSEYKNADGDVLNSHLRRRTDRDRRGTRYLTGELWRGFATLRRDDVAKR